MNDMIKAERGKIISKNRLKFFLLWELSLS